MLKSYLKWWKMVIFKNLSKNGEMLKNIGENIKKKFALIFFYTLDIRNIILTQSFTNMFCHLYLWLIISRLRIKAYL